ncbi:MAG: tetratricopeptide repeat protein [Calditrichaeota bacterium]|nr:tetratricopeptide repeat protein [Calditrichota bacterium]
MQKNVIFGLFIVWVAAVPIWGQQYNENNDFSYALKLYNEGFYDIAAQQFSLFINRYPQSNRIPDAKYYLADALFRTGDVENARIEFQSLAVSFPKHPRAPEAWMRVGECYQAQQKWEDAAKAYETVKILYPADARAPGALLKAVENYFTLQKLNEAERILREFLDRYLESAEYPRGRLLFGRLLVQKEQLDQALNEFQKVIELTEDAELVATAELGRAEVYEKLGLLNRAEEGYQQILKTARGSEAALQAVQRLSRIYLDNARYREAESLLRKHLTYYTQSTQRYPLQLNLGRALYLQNKIAEARKIFRELKDQEADTRTRQQVMFYLAACEQSLQKWDAAIRSYDELIQQGINDSLNSPYLSTGLLNLARIYRDRGDFSALQSIVHAYQRVFPRHRNVEALLRLYIQTALERGFLNESRTALVNYQQEFPRSPYRDELIYQMGKNFWKAGDIQTSREYFQELLQKYTSSPYVDSSRIYLNFIENFQQVDQNLGVAQLARLMGKLLVNEDREQLLFELGQIYLFQLKDYPQAIQIFEQTARQGRDSVIVARSLFYLCQSYIRQLEYNRFLHRAGNELEQKALDYLRETMSYRRHVPYPDTLTFWFLTRALPQPKKDQLQRTIRLWEHFVTNYPQSELRGWARLRLAQLHLQNGDTVAALAQYDALLSDPRRKREAGLAYWRKARILWQQGNGALAIQTLKDFLLKLPGHVLEARAYWQIARWLGQNGEYALASQFLERLLEQFDYTELAQQARSELANFYLLAGNYQKAREYLADRLRQIPRKIDPILRQYLPPYPHDLFFYAGKAAYELQQFTEARRDLLTFLQQHGDSPLYNEAQFLLGKMAYVEGDRQAALMHFSLVKKEGHPEIFYQARELVADILMNDGKYVDAQKIYEELIRLREDPEKTIFYAAQRLKCLINQKKTKTFRQELNIFKSTYKKHPQRDHYLAALEFEQGRVAYREKNFNQALKHFETVRKKFKKTDYVDDALYFTGLTYTTLNRSEDAMKALTEFLKKYPESDLLGDVYNTLGNLYFRGEKIDLALDAFRKALDAAQKPSTRQFAMANLINLYKTRGLWDSALELTRRYIQEFPNARDIMDRKVFVGICLINLNRFSDAIEYLRQLKFEASSELEPEIQFYIGEAYFNAGQYENAIREFVKIPLLSRRTKLQWEASALYFSGQAYEKLGRIDDAIRMYQEIVKRPGILIDLKREAQRRIKLLQQTH